MGMVSQARLIHRRWSKWTIEVYHTHDGNASTILYSYKNIARRYCTGNFERIHRQYDLLEGSDAVKRFTSHSREDTESTYKSSKFGTENEIRRDEKTDFNANSEN